MGSDRRLYKEIEHTISMSKSPAVEHDLSISPFGAMTEGASKKTFMFLIATLNASYFDYDFRYVLYTIPFFCCIKKI